MKPISEYLTPETNSVNKSTIPLGWQEAYSLMRRHAKDLEQRLAARGEALERIMSVHETASDALDEAEQMERIARETLTATAPKP